MSVTNKKTVLDLLRQQNQLTKAELSQTAGLTIPTVSKILDTLVAEGLVTQGGIGDSSGGRKPGIFKFNHEDNYIIGIDLGGTYIRGILTDLNANILYEIQIPTEIKKGFVMIMDKISDIVQKIVAHSLAKNGKIWGVGLGIAGLVNNQTGEVEFSPDFKWENINLYNELKTRINLPFFYDNSSRLMALGELEFGDKSTLKNFAVLNIGYGIASGLVIEGNLVKGNNGFAGEFGHIPIDASSGIQCKCGQFGCLEALASGDRIAELGREVLAQGKSEGLLMLSEKYAGIVDAKIIAEAAIAGDQPSIEIYEKISENICLGIRALANLFNPETIFMGGGVSLNEGLLLNMIRKNIQKHLFQTNIKLNIQPATFGDYSTIKGAVSLVLNKILNFELIYSEDTRLDSKASPITQVA